MTVDRDVWHLARRPGRPTMVGMTAETKSEARVETQGKTRGNLRFAGHYLEMVVAMIVGMAALGPLWS
ncbi:MAG TPA: hypothetical protein VFT95_08705, partial [Micromonosporaceae bacterium]|nr:hypothetical protein [Micromonosporaceae bacterium]